MKWKLKQVIETKEFYEHIFTKPKVGKRGYNCEQETKYITILSVMTKSYSHNYLQNSAQTIEQNNTIDLEAHSKNDSFTRSLFSGRKFTLEVHYIEK